MIETQQGFGGATWRSKRVPGERFGQGCLVRFVGWSVDRMLVWHRVVPARSRLRQASVCVFREPLRGSARGSDWVFDDPN